MDFSPFGSLLEFVARPPFFPVATREYQKLGLLASSSNMWPSCLRDLASFVCLTASLRSFLFFIVNYFYVALGAKARYEFALFIAYHGEQRRARQTRGDQFTPLLKGMRV